MPQLTKPMAQIPSQNHLSKFNPSKSRAILILIRGNGGAGFVLLNQDEVKFEAKKMGFNVIILSQHLSPMTPMHKVFELIHSSHAVIRIHAQYSCKRYAMEEWLGMWGRSTLRV